MTEIVWTQCKLSEWEYPEFKDAFWEMIASEVDDNGNETTGDTIASVLFDEYGMALSAWVDGEVVPDTSEFTSKIRDAVDPQEYFEWLWRICKDLPEDMSYTDIAKYVETMEKLEGVSG